jgi:XTP/dITP diphosphohydrolase
MTQPLLLIASNNPGKAAEFRALLAGTGWQVVTPADVGLVLEVGEEGASYRENALLKARAFAEASGLPSLADDSGLEVDALGGEPGPLHHVRGWDGRDNEERIAILLRALAGVPPERRTARFRAVIVVAHPDGRIIDAEGACEGVIAPEPRGEGGFGYDPVFLLPELGLTMAELSPEEKNRHSHRAAAVRGLRQGLTALARP